MLRLEGVTVAYGQKLIFENLSFAIEKPGFYLILGKNGSGKSILLKVMAGRLKPSKGKVFLGETRLYTLFGKDSPPVAYLGDGLSSIPDEPIEAIFRNLARHLGLKESFESFCKNLRLPRADEGLGRMRPSQLASSELAEVELALTLVWKPSYVFLDDTFSSLSFATLNRVTDNLCEWTSLNKALCILASSRFFGFMDKFDEVYLLSEGNLKSLYPGHKPDTQKQTKDDKELSLQRGRFVIVRCGEFFYRQSRLETDNEFFRLIAVLEDELVIELRQSLDAALDYLESMGIDIRGVDFERESPEIEKSLAEIVWHRSSQGKH